MKKWIELLMLSVLGLACRSEAPKESEVPPTPVVQPDAGVSEVEKEEAAVEPLSMEGGEMIAFGVRLPPGMKPVSAGPQGVYRFEGTYQEKALLNYIKKQVSTRNVVPEGSGYIMRHGKVRRPLGKATGKEWLAIRIQKRPGGGGSHLDFWLDQPPRERSSSARTAARRARGGSPKTVIMNPKATKSRKQSRKETTKVMGKVMRGEELTEEEKNSPFFN